MGGLATETEDIVTESDNEQEDTVIESEDMAVEHVDAENAGLAEIKSAEVQKLVTKIK